MSEAQQYQLIRKHWKDLYRKAQRKQSIATWEREHKERHPSVMSFLAERGIKARSAVNSPKQSDMEAWTFQQEASSYATLLNRFKVKQND